MKKSIFLLFLYMLATTNVWCGNIVYPWRSTTAFVRSGEHFEVWFNASNGQTVNSIQLKNAYTTLATTISTVSGNWTYDSLSGNTYNRKITVTVPSNAPEDRYDLILITTSGKETSYGGVKVVKDYMDNYYIMHISDGHIYQGGHDPLVLLARKSAMIDIANIMDCQIIMETGDNMYNVINHSDRLDQFFLGIESESIKGMADASAATFLIPGNHDAPIANNFQNSMKEENSAFFNEYWGLQNASFKYGNGRFMMINNSWKPNEHEYQAHDAVNWLKDAGAGGNFFVSAGHSYSSLHNIINNYKPLSLVLAGHNHYLSSENPREFATGSSKIAYIAASIRDHFHFNLFRVNNSTGQYDVVPGSTGVAEVLSSGNINDPSTWQLNLTLSYSKNNSGSNKENSATIVNKFNFPILGARVRFVMPKGHTYEINDGNGYIHQEFHGSEFYILDVKFDVPAGSTRSIGIAVNDETDRGNNITDIFQYGVPSTLTLSQTSTFQNINAENPWFFIQLTDPQFGMFENNEGFDKETILYEKAVAEVNRLKPDFLVITGDFVHNQHSQEQIEEFKRITAKIYPEIPVYFIPGNHDIGENPTKESLKKYTQLYGKDRFAFEHKGSYLIGFNTGLIKSNLPKEERKQYEWLKSNLEKGRNKNHVILFSHYPFFIENIEEPEANTNLGIASRYKYLSLFDTYKATAVFSGHYHNNALGNYGNIQMVTTSAVGKPLGKAPSGMRVVKIYKDRIEHEYFGLDELPDSISFDDEGNDDGVVAIPINSLPAHFINLH